MSLGRINTDSNIQNQSYLRIFEIFYFKEDNNLDYSKIKKYYLYLVAFILIICLLFDFTSYNAYKLDNKELLSLNNHDLNVSVIN